MSDQITVAENVYRGGTIVAPEGSTLTPDMAYALGVGDDGKVDQSLSTDDLLERQRETGVRAAEGAGTVVAAGDTDRNPSIEGATADEVIAFLQANPAEVDYVESLEGSRSQGPRKTVMEAVDRIRSGG